MIVKLSELPEDGLTIESVARGFADPAWRLDGLRLTLAPAGADVVVTGEVTATVPQTCGRCLEEFPASVRAAVDVRLLPRPATADPVELGRDDLDVDFYAGDEIDVAALVETETSLALPMKPLCRPDCRGLCPACGGNLNTSACGCPPRPPDPRLAVLRDLATRVTH